MALISKFIRSLDPALFAVSAMKFLLHAAVNLSGGYGYFRDEFYYLACGRHPAFGYVDHPPMIAGMAAFSEYVLGGSVFAIRLIPAFAGAAVVYFTGVLAGELGGGRSARMFASIAVLAAPVFMGTHGFLSMNPFDHLFWTLAILLMVRIFNGNAGRNWTWFGVVLGLGLMNKHGMAFLIIGLVAGLLLSKQRGLIFTRNFWIAAGIATLIFAPNIMWEIAYGFPTLEWARNAAEMKNVVLTPAQLFRDMVPDMNHASVPLFIAGLFMLLASSAGARYRAIGWGVVTVFVLFGVSHGKPYYFATLYPALFAAGSVWFEAIAGTTQWKWVPRILTAATVAIMIVAAPFALPILPVDTFINYEAALGRKPKAEERNALAELPQHFADRFGWQELSDAVSRVYAALPDSEKPRAAVFAQNYGEAGSLEFLSKPGSIPPVICGHNNYWLWGPGDFKGDVLIIVGGDIEDHRRVFGSVELAAESDNPHSMPYERHLGIYVARKSLVPIHEAWERCRKYI